MDNKLGPAHAQPNNTHNYKVFHILFVRKNTKRFLISFNAEKCFPLSQGRKKHTLNDKLLYLPPNFFKKMKIP